VIQSPNDLRIVGIGGSLRAHSFSYLALEYAMRRLAGMGCRTRIADLRKMSLPFCNGDKNELWSAYPAVAELRRVVAKANALVLATPEYHGSISGVLKNALDLLDPKDLEGKVAGVISVLGGPANSNALNDLSRIMRWCHAWVIPQHIAIGRARAVFLDTEIADQELRDRFDEFTKSLVWTALRICELDSADALASYAS